MCAAWMGIEDDFFGDGERQDFADEALEELKAAEGADELCRLLLSRPFGWGTSPRPAEAVELLRAVSGTSELGDGFLALLLCSCGRWDRVTAKLIAALEASGLLGDSELDELADSFLSDGLNVQCTVGWLAPEWLEIDLDSGQTERVRLPEDTMTTIRLTVEPPLRRWGAARALRGAPERLDDLLTLAERVPRLQGYAVLQGLLDSAGALGGPTDAGW